MAGARPAMQRASFLDDDENFGRRKISNPYAAGRTAPRSTTNYSPVKSMGNPKDSKPDYDIGDTVSHVKFGTGVVKNIVEGGRDFEVTVDFDNFGVKKMFASFAKLKKQ